MSAYINELAGVVGLGYMNRSLLDFARAIRVTIEEEQRKLNCDTHLVALLCDAARVGWELGQTVNLDRRDLERDMWSAVKAMYYGSTGDKGTPTLADLRQAADKAIAALIAFEAEGGRPASEG